MLTDYHLHTFLSDGTGKHEDYIKEAIRKHIGEIGFSEHFNCKKYYYSMKFSNLPVYVKIINDLKKKFGITIKLGIEIDFVPGFEQKIRKIINKYPFDYVMGSVHLINGWLFDSRDISNIKKWDIYKLYETYFKLVQQAANSKLFDIMAHPDVIKKIGLKPKKNISNLLRKTADCFKKNKVCIEVNTSGLDRPCKEIYPSKEFLKMCFNRKIPIILSSDAHKPEDVGQHFNETIKLIKNVGYRKIVQFTNRKRNFLKI